MVMTRRASSRRTECIGAGVSRHTIDTTGPRSAETPKPAAKAVVEQAMRKG